MRRILFGLLLGALIFAGAVGAKVVTVTNPMSGDLDGGGYNIKNTGSIFATDLVASFAVQAPRYKVTDDAGDNTQIIFGQDDPTIACPPATPGALYLRRTVAFKGQLWLQTDYPCGWALVAGTP